MGDNHNPSEWRRNHLEAVLAHRGDPESVDAAKLIAELRREIGERILREVTLEYALRDRKPEGMSWKQYVANLAKERNDKTMHMIRSRRKL